VTVPTEDSRRTSGVVRGQIVEHWACRDDLGLLRQVGAWPLA